MEAYLDNAATTRAADEVAKVVTDIMLNDYGNPSSKHSKGFDAEKQVKQAAQIIAKTLKCDEKEILFTSGGTESNNMAIIESAIANKRRGNHVIVSSVEHSSVKEPFRYLEENGFNVTYLPVDNRGLVSVDALKEALDEETILVSVMLVNNEIGTIEPVEKIGKIVKDYNKDIIFHVDAIQAYGKMRIYPKKMNIDLLSVSGHKIHGPKGTGFLFIKDKTKIKPLILGGGQQRERVGYAAVEFVVGAVPAVELVEHRAVLYEQHPLRAARRLRRVSHHQYRLTAAVYLCEKREQLVGASAVESARRLVREEQFRLGYHRPCCGGALLLTSGYLIGVLVEQRGYPEQLRSGVQLRLHGRVLFAPQHQREQYVVPHRERIQQVELLEHEPQIVPAEIRELRFLYLREVHSVEDNAAPGRLVERRENIQQRGLSGAALAHYRDVFPRLRSEADVLQRFHAVSAEACGVGLSETCYL